MKVALYVRVSLDEAAGDRRFQDTANQKEPLLKWAAGMGWEVVKVFEDHESGANPARSAFREMMDAARLHEFDAVLVWKLDRLSREPMSSTLAYIQRLKKAKVALKSLTESWMDTADENPVSEIVLAVMAWAASEERRKISERTKAGIARLRAIGRWKGGRPRKQVEEKGSPSNAGVEIAVK